MPSASRTTMMTATARFISLLLYLFRPLKERDHLRSEQHRQIRRADNTVVVLAGRRAACANNEFVHFGRELEDDFPILFLREVHKGKNVEITITDMAGHRIHHIVFV